MSATIFDPSNIFWITSTSLIGVVLIKHILEWRKSGRGPPRLPFLGNALQMPNSHGWVVFSEWAKRYGDIIHLKILGQDMIILSSAKTAQDMLGKRSLVYSSRPKFVFGGDLVGFGEGFAVMPYGNAWRAQRKILAKDFAPATMPKYHPLQETASRQLVLNALDKPDSLEHIVKWRIGSIILRVLYGYRASSSNDIMLNTGLEGMEYFSLSFEAGRWIVDVIPALRYLPTWMPGSAFIETAARWRAVVQNMAYKPYTWCKDKLESDIVQRPNCCESILAKADENFSPEDEKLLAWACFSAFGGGLDTKISTILTFFLTMILNPSVQEKARAEIDSVIGSERLPCISDRPNLPYVRSVMTEVYRWMPAVPLGLPHALSESDVYDGIYLPKGTIIVPNVWHMLHDATLFPDPHTFNPSRYESSETLMSSVTDLAFGFGRRSCPGSHFADGTIFATIATVLATCEVLPAVDEEGKDVLPEVEYTSGTIVFPKPFKCRLKARSAHALELLSQSASAE